MGLHKGTSCIVPVTAVRGMKYMLQCSVQYVEEQKNISEWDFVNSVSGNKYNSFMIIVNIYIYIYLECVFYPNLNLSETLP